MKVPLSLLLASLAVGCWAKPVIYLATTEEPTSFGPDKAQEDPTTAEPEPVPVKTPLTPEDPEERPCHEDEDCVVDRKKRHTETDEDSSDDTSEESTTETSTTEIINYVYARSPYPQSPTPYPPEKKCDLKFMTRHEYSECFISKLNYRRKRQATETASIPATEDKIQTDSTTTHEPTPIYFAPVFVDDTSDENQAPPGWPF